MWFVFFAVLLAVGLIVFGVNALADHAQEDPSLPIVFYVPFVAAGLILLWAGREWGSRSSAREGDQPDKHGGA